MEFLLGVAGVTSVDDVRMQEDGMIVNGDFVNGMVGWEAYVNETAKVSYGVDELTEKNIAMGFTISDTGDQDWKIQLKQNNIKLEEGKCYRIRFDARSIMDRTIMYALQRDGSSDDNWIPYSGTQKVDLTSTYQTYEHVFKMTNATDEKTILSISMGAVNGTQITDKHTVYIDNVSLEEVPESEIPTAPEAPAGDNMIANGDFAAGEANWEKAITAPGTAEVSFSDGKAVYDISNVGNADWNVQLKQAGLTLEQGADYELKFTVKSSEARTIKAAFLTATYGWYGGADIVLEKDVAKTVNVPLHVNQATDINITFVISMGVIDGVETPESVIEIDDISLVKKSAGGEPETPEVPAGENMIANGDFANAEANWENAITAPGAAEVSFADGKVVYNISNVGAADWNVQLKQTGLTLEQGSDYELSFTVKSSEARTIKAALLGGAPSYAWYGGADIVLEKDEPKVVCQTIHVEAVTNNDMTFVVSMGVIDGVETPVSVIEIDDIRLVKK